MSGLTKKSVYADKTLSTLLGVEEGELVSYAQLSKGLHKYIKDNDLRNLKAKPALPAIPLAAPAAVPAVRVCRDCGAQIPSGAVFCDMCGVSQ
jgi:hypothetical protein